jgi:hypothetical protein
MKWSSNRNWAASFGAAGLVFVLGASASAESLYSWKTEDGTFAYTNERKQIPVKYKAEAKKSNLKSMESFDRFTPGPKSDGKAHQQRVVERLEVLRTSLGSSEQMGSASAGERVVNVNVRGGGRNGGNQAEVQIPVGLGMNDMEPVVVEHVRMKPVAGSNATRHARVVKQGDRVLAVIKDRQLDNPLTPKLDERDFDGNSVD